MKMKYTWGGGGLRAGKGARERNSHPTNSCVVRVLNWDTETPGQMFLL